MESREDGRFEHLFLGGAIDNSFTPSIWEPPSKIGEESNGLDGPSMALWGFQSYQVSSGSSNIIRLAPLWALVGPIGWEIVIEKIEWDQNLMDNTVGSPSTSSAHIIINPTNNPINTSVEYEYTITKSTSFQMDRNITETAGVGVSAEVTVSAGVGFVDASATAGFSAFAEISGTLSSSRQAGEENSVTTRFSEEVTVEPKTTLKHTAKFKKTTCRGLRWTGHVLLKFDTGITEVGRVYRTASL